MRGQFLETFFSATHSCLPKHYSVLHFQLYHGADEYGVAGSWLSDALNTNIHTFEVGKVLPWVTLSKDHQVAPSFIIIEHSVLGHIRKLFDWGEQVGASSQSASFHIFLQCVSMSFNISLCLQTSSALLIRTSRVIHYLQLAGTYHILNEHLKSMLGTINQYKMYYNFHESNAFSREMAFSLQAAACPTCTA